MNRGPFSPLEPGTYLIDPDGDGTTSLRVDIPSEGWSAWVGAAKFADVGHTGISITTVSTWSPTAAAITPGRTRPWVPASTLLSRP